MDDRDRRVQLREERAVEDELSVPEDVIEACLAIKANRPSPLRYQGWPKRERAERAEVRAKVSEVLNSLRALEKFAAAASRAGLVEPSVFLSIGAATDVLVDGCDKLWAEFSREDRPEGRKKRANVSADA